MYPSRPFIEVDQEKCGNPIDCMKCIQVCPYRLLGLLQRDPPEPGSPEGPKEFNLIAAFRIMCTACGMCEKVCPKEAIKVYSEV